MPFTPVDGTTLFHLQVGTGTPCLVMHGGLGVDHTQFRAGLVKFFGFFSPVILFKISTEFK